MSDSSADAEHVLEWIDSEMDRLQAEAQGLADRFYAYVLPINERVKSKEERGFVRLRVRVRRRSRQAKVQIEWAELRPVRGKDRWYINPILIRRGKSERLPLSSLHRHCGKRSDVEALVEDLEHRFAELRGQATALSRARQELRRYFKRREQGAEVLERRGPVDDIVPITEEGGS